MRIVRFGDAGKERPGLIDTSGAVRDLSAVVDDWTGAHLGPSELGRVARLAHERYPVVSSGTRLGMPLAGVGKFIAIGLNYKDHAEEAKQPIPSGGIAPGIPEIRLGSGARSRDRHDLALR